MDEMLPQDSDGDEKARAFRVSNFLLALDEFPLSGRVDRQTRMFNRRRVSSLPVMIER